MKTTPFRKRLKYSVLPAFKTTNQILHYDRNSNFGDMLNPKIANMLSQSSKILVDPKYCSRKHILLLGSILQKATKNSIVWGSGFISADSKCLEAPHEVLAIRGPLSGQNLNNKGLQHQRFLGIRRYFCQTSISLRKQRRSTHSELSHTTSTNYHLN